MKFRTHKENLNLALKVQFEGGVFVTENEELIALIRSRAKDHDIIEVPEVLPEVETGDSKPVPEPEEAPVPAEVTLADVMLVGSAALSEMRGLTAEELSKKYSAKELKAACALLGLPQTGKKEALIGELIRHFDVPVSS